MDNTQPILAAWAASSADATQVSNTIKGLVTALSSILILAVALTVHIQLNAGDVISYGTELGTVIGFIWGLAGFILKGIHFIAKKKPVVLAPFV